jgi:hypothetical protein
VWEADERSGEKEMVEFRTKGRTEETRDTIVINETETHDNIRDGAKGTAWRHSSRPGIDVRAPGNRIRTDSGTTKGNGWKEVNASGNCKLAALPLLNPPPRLGAMDSYRMAGVLARCDECLYTFLRSFVCGKRIDGKAL